MNPAGCLSECHRILNMVADRRSSDIVVPAWIMRDLGIYDSGRTRQNRPGDPGSLTGEPDSGRSYGL
jgi:hypothetical protein